jgi:hypothetical protein
MNQSKMFKSGKIIILNNDWIRVTEILMIIFSLIIKQTNDIELGAFKWQDLILGVNFSVTFKNLLFPP